MENFKLYDAEYKFISIIWETEPVRSPELVTLCFQKLGWKKSTTYTMIKRMSKRSFIQSADTVVTSLLKREQAMRLETDTLLHKHFGGSLPSFVAAFLQDKKLSEAEVKEIEEMIQRAKE